MLSDDQITAYRKLVGSWITQLRIEKGLSKNQLSKLTGIDRKYLNDIESGNHSFSIDIIAKLSHALSFFIFFVPKDSNDPLAKAMKERWGKMKDN